MILTKPSKAVTLRAKLTEVLRGAGHKLLWTFAAEDRKEYVLVTGDESKWYEGVLTSFRQTLSVLGVNEMAVADVDTDKLIGKDVMLQMNREGDAVKHIIGT